MTILKCSAVKCMYNENELCSRGDIEITGANARHAEDTTCGSFRDRNSSGSAMNCDTQHCGCEKINIAAQVKNVSPNAVKINPLIKRRGSISQENKNSNKNININKVVIVTL